MLRLRWCERPHCGLRQEQASALARKVIGAAVGNVLVVCEAVVRYAVLGFQHDRVSEPCAVWLACSHVGWVGACVAVVALEVG